MAEEMKATDVLGATFQNASSKGGKANKFPAVDATYKVAVGKASIFASTDPRTKGQTIFQVNLTVVETSNPEVAPRSVKAWTQNLSQTYDDRNYGEENLKQFVAAVYGLEPGTPKADSLGPAHVQAILDGKAEGNMVVLTTAPKTSKSERDWILHIFSPAPDA